MPEESDREFRTPTVLLLVIERFACMASTRLPLRPINRRSPTRGSCALSPLAYPLPNSRPSSALTRMEYYNRTLDRAREAPHRLPGTDLDPRCGASKASTVWRQVATAVWRQVARAVWRQVATAEAHPAATGANMRRLGRIRVLIYNWAAAGLPQTSEP